MAGLKNWFNTKDGTDSKEVFAEACTTATTGVSQILATDPITGKIHPSFLPPSSACSIVSISKSALESLRTSSSLDICAAYRITDNTAATGGDIIVRPVDVNRLSSSALYVDPAISAEALACSYNHSNNQITQMYNHDRGVTVVGVAMVNSFPWTATAITHSFFKDSTLNYTGGTLTDIEMRDSQLTISGGNFTQCTLSEDAKITIISGGNYQNLFNNRVTYTQVGTGTIRQSTMSGAVTWVNGDVNITNIRATTASANLMGTSGTISNCSFNRSYLTSCQNITNLSITDSTLSDACQISATGASHVSIYRTHAKAGFRFLVAANKRLTCSYGDLSTYGYFQVLDGELFSSHDRITNYSYIQHNSPGINHTSRVNLNSSSRVRFLDTCTGCRVYYSSGASNGIIEHRGTSNGCYIYYSSSTSSAQIYTRNSVTARMYYSMATSSGRIYSDSNSTIHYMYYCKADAGGQVLAYNNTASIRMYSIHASAQGIGRIHNSAVAGRLYYSSFHAYFYAYITLTTTATKSALHGYGRRTYSVTNPPNGTFVQNF